MPRRPPIPADLEREILLEAGHRCAIHTCRQTPLELAHIVPWSRCKDHTYENIIALCPTCHTRFDKGEIDRKSMAQYKARLLVHAGRFSDFEIRLLRRLGQSGDDEVWLLTDLELLIDGLVRHSLLIKTGLVKKLGAADELLRGLYKLTDEGKAFIQGQLK